MSNNAIFKIDTSGGPISFYYNEPTDLRGATEASAVIRMDPGTRIDHVKCGGLSAPTSDSCDSQVSDRVYARIGIPDQLNFFGRDRGNWQWLTMGLSKISGLWLYFLRGYVQLKTSTCLQAGGTPRPINFYTDNEQWQFSGMIWMDQLRPCGWFHFRIQPSDAAPVALPSNWTFNDWNGIDWVARSVSGSRHYANPNN